MYEDNTYGELLTLSSVSIGEEKIIIDAEIKRRIKRFKRLHWLNRCNGVSIL